MKFKITNESVIETTRFMAGAVEDATAIVEGICQTHRLTPDFIREFKDIITPEMFMSSFRLSKEMAERYPELFDSEQFKEYMKHKEVEIEEDETQPVNFKIATAGTNRNGVTMPVSSLQQFMSQMFPSSEDEKKVIVTDNLKNISISMLCEYYDTFKDDENYTMSDELVKNIIRDSSEEEINESDVLCLMGISAEIDELLLKRIKDEDLKNTILLTMSVSEDHQMTSSTYKHLSNDMKEDILGDEEVSVREFINALADTQDLGWQIKMINRAVNGEITLTKSGQVYDKEIVLLISKLPESEVVKLTKLSNAMPNTFSYKAVKWMLDNKDFSEDNLIEMLDVIKKAGLWFDLMKIARDNNYENLKNAMKK